MSFFSSNKPKLPPLPDLRHMAPTILPPPPRQKTLPPPLPSLRKPESMTVWRAGEVIDYMARKYNLNKTDIMTALDIHGIHTSGPIKMVRNNTMFHNNVQVSIEILVLLIEEFADKTLTDSAEQWVVPLLIT